MGRRRFAKSSDSSPESRSIDRRRAASLRDVSRDYDKDRFMLLAILNNVSMLALAAFGLFWAMRRRGGSVSPSRRPVQLGALLGVIAFIVTANPVQGPFDAILDGRAGPILFAGFLGGPVAGLIAATGGAIARYWMGGSLVFSGVLIFFVYAAAGAALRHFRNAADDDPVSFEDMGRLALASFAGAAVMAIFIAPEARMNWIVATLPFILMANLLAIIVVGLSFRLLGEDARAVAAVHQARDRLELAARSAGLGVWDYDVASGVVDWDDRQNALHHLPPGGFGGRYEDWEALLHPQDRARAVSEFQAAMRGEADFDTEFRIVTPTGEIRHLRAAAIILEDEAGAPHRVVGMNFDLTALRESQAEVTRNEERFAAMTANLPGVLFRMTRHAPGDFGFDCVSPGCEDLVERKADALIADPEIFWGMITDQDRFDLAAHFVASAQDMEPLIAEFSIRTPAGRVKHLQCIGRPEAIEGEVLVWNAVALDVTGRVRADEELARNRELFHQAQRLEAVGKLSGGIAHDFNNLLGVIQGNAELVAGEVPDGRPRRALEDMVRATERAAELTGQLLAFSRRAPLSPRVIAVDESLEEMRSLISRTLPESIRLDVRPAGDETAIRADSSQLASALLNLVLNARDAMPEGGVLSLDAAVDRLFAEDFQDGEDPAPGEYVRISVIDSGVGMTEEVQARALEPFFTTKEVGEGSGMGLAMVSGFVRQSGGFMRLESAPGEGARISIFFPRAEAEPRQDDVAPEVPHGGAERILLVEDNSALRDTLLRQIDALGYDAVGAEDGDVALAFLDAGERFDLVLTDMVMPGPVQGPKLAEEVRRRRPGLPVLLMSGYADLGEERDGWQARIDLPKPIRMKALADALKTALEKAGAD
jgi:signal transduction histidine kinase